MCVALQHPVAKRAVSWIRGRRMAELLASPMVMGRVPTHFYTQLHPITPEGHKWLAEPDIIGCNRV